MDASTLSKGKSTERNGDGRPINLPGIYTHKEAEAQVITAEGDEGVVQADALVRLGYERTGDVPSRIELLKMQKAQERKDAVTAAVEKKAEEAEINALAAGGEYVPDKK